MLRLQNISLYQFKNYSQTQFDFTAKVVAVCGNNGVGKTNLLDAIYLLCFSKSYLSKTDAANVSRGTQGMRLEGNFLRQDAPENVTCILRENNKKELARNGENYKRFSQHIGLLPCVMIAPDDVELVTGTSDVRRKFIDTLLSQLDSGYLEALIAYNKILTQRNSLLKATSDRGYVDRELLDVLDKQLVRPGSVIFDKRRGFLKDFLPGVAQGYDSIAGNSETAALSYYSQLFEDDFERLLKTFREKDIMLQRTTIGIHKDDIEITLAGEVFKNIASQGQRKSLLFALKLAEFDTLKKAMGFAPLLLLDDVFEKLDAGRISNLLVTVCKSNDGQVFITDTHNERLEQAMADINVDFQLITLEPGLLR